MKWFFYILIYLVYVFIIIPLLIIFFFKDFKDFKWYRRLKGGKWQQFYPRNLPYLIMWTNESLANGCIQLKEEQFRNEYKID